jgi:hypothetical protein
MTTVTLLLLVGLVIGGAVAAVAVGVARGRDRRNHVVPGVPTSAPAAWAGAHTPEARLHRRLRAAVDAAIAAAPKPTSPLGGARRALEETALAVDERLVAVAAVPERERGPLLVDVTAQVAGVEQAAAMMARTRLEEGGDIAAGVDRALEGVRLLAEARAEVEQLDRPWVVLPEADVPDTAEPGEVRGTAGPGD